ncbi:putative nucleotidyltransferase, ribonuclease H [Tanacetum coccineum]
MANSVTTRSGLNYKPLKNPLENVTTSQKGLTTKETTIKSGDNDPDKPRKSMESFDHSIPFPGQLKKEKEKEQFRKFFENLQQLSMNIPFFEALEQMPKYAKFMKDLLTRKGKIEEISKIILNERCFAVLLNKISFKEKDLGSFTIPCVIGKVGIDKALADLGASISLMSYSTYARLDLGELKPTRMCIELANKSTQYPRGIAENVIIKIDKFVFPMDFVVLDIKEDHKIPIILGRPFLATVHAMIDVFNNKISFEVGNETITTNLWEEEDNNSEDLDEAGLPFDHDNWEPIRPNLFSTNTIEAEKQPLKLKELPSHLKYAFLNNKQEFPVIISSLLNSQEKESLLKVLMQHKTALAWKVVDIKGISPSFCTHKILMKDNFKPVVQPQRRLNPKVQDVVKAEIVKLLYGTSLNEFGGSNEGTGSKPGVPDESTVVSSTSSEGTGAKPGVPDKEKDITEEKVILEWGDKQDSKFSDDDNDDVEKDDKDGDADDEGDDHVSDTQDADDEDDETESDEDEIYKYKIRVRKDEDVEMKDGKVEESDKGKERVTNAAKEEAEKSSEVNDDTKKTELPPSSSSLSVFSGFGDQFLKLSSDSSLVSTVKDFVDTNVSSLLDIPIQQETPQIQSPLVQKVPVSVIPEITNLPPIPEIVTETPLRVAKLEKDVSELKTIDHSTEALAVLVTPPDGAWTEYVSGGVTLLNISSTKHKERPLRVSDQRQPNQYDMTYIRLSGAPWKKVKAAKALEQKKQNIEKGQIRPEL